MTTLQDVEILLTELHAKFMVAKLAGEKAEFQFVGLNSAWWGIEKRLGCALEHVRTLRNFGDLRVVGLMEQQRAASASEPA